MLRFQSFSDLITKAKIAHTTYLKLQSISHIFRKRYESSCILRSEQASSLTSVGSRSVAIYVSGMPRRLLYGASAGVIFHEDRTPWFKPWHFFTFRTNL